VIVADNVGPVPSAGSVAEQPHGLASVL